MLKSYKYFIKHADYVTLIIAIVATLGSLYYSDIKGYTPCILCWYQRICMYALVPVILTGIVRRDDKVYHFTFPLACIGFLIAFYHNLLYTKIIFDDGKCSTGVSCTTKYIEYFGFITIPFLSLLAFSLILIFAVLKRRYTRLKK